MPSAGPVELTDLLGGWDGSGSRVPVVRAEVVDRLRSSGQLRAARIAARLPATPDGCLHEPSVDALLVRVHTELQRFSEEMQQGRRVAEHLDPLIARLDPTRAPVRVVDVGCGLGYVVRWLAAHSRWSGVELVGVDHAATLVDRARELAAYEDLECAFRCGDALDPQVALADPARTIVISTGLLHHLRGADLERFFVRQADAGVHAFVHWDPEPSPWTTLGAWIFHRARMREAVSRHDGVLSARRAHPARELGPAVTRWMPDYDVECRKGRSRAPDLVDALRPVSGIRR